MSARLRERREELYTIRTLQAAPVTKQRLETRLKSGVQKTLISGAKMPTYKPYKAPAPAPAPVMAGVPVLEGLGTAMNVWQLLTGAIPGKQPGEIITPWEAGELAKPKKIYTKVYVRNGRIYSVTAKGERMLGYTPRGAKKKFRVKRRRKRLTKRDLYILQVIERTGNTAALPLIL